MIVAAWTLTLAAALGQLVPPPGTAQAAADRPIAARAAALADESKALSALADRLKAAGNAADAAAVRALMEPPAPPEGMPERLALLPEIVPAPEPPAAADVPQWRADVLAIQARAAKALMMVAAAAAKAGRYALASRCLREVVAREPQHPEARRLLGYVPHEGGWAKAHAADYLSKGFVLDPTFGWVQADWLPHLARGELPGRVAAGGRVLEWLPAAEADAMRSGWDPPWEINTEHFAIRTNVPLDGAIEFGRKLEALHDAFFDEFADVIGPELPLARRFRDPNRRATADTKSHAVMYFANRQGYVEYLTPRFGKGIGESLGFYSPPTPGRGGKSGGGQSYFFRDEGGPIDVTSTLYHEASHQLLFESAGTARYDNNVGNYWVWEGLGTYFETFHPDPAGHFCRIGGLVGPRVGKAQEDLAADRLVPVGELVRLSRSKFDDDRMVYTNYAESMALAIYLIHGDGGKHRGPFLEYVRDAYAGRLRPGSSGRPLDQRLGMSYEELDAGFRTYLAIEPPVAE